MLLFTPYFTLGINTCISLKYFLLFDTASWHYVFKTTFLKQKGIQFLNNKLYEDFNWNLKILKEANELMKMYKISGLPVVDEENNLKGIITNRDLK